MREVYKFKFFDPSTDTFGFLSIAADTEHAALMTFNSICNYTWINQLLVKFI
jgi:hypothetical protein